MSEKERRDLIMDKLINYHSKNGNKTIMEAKQKLEVAFFLYSYLKKYILNDI